MPLSRSRDYLSIGEVLEQVRQEFPDVTISKIRFLETEGLITPERTPSGYRKFYEADVRRLRQILSLQRDRFLPLRVIRQHLDAGEGEDGGHSQSEDAPAAPRLQDVQLTREELRAAAGLSERELDELEEYGVVGARRGGSFDGDDLVTAKAARGLFKYGVEARHLRMYRQFAERETAFFEQIISPLTRRNDDEASREVGESIEELARLTRQLHDALRRARVRALL